MFFAIHKNTGTRINAIKLLTIPDSIRREDEYIAPIEEILEKGDSDGDIILKYRLGSEYDINGKSHTRSPCFYIPNKNKLGIKTIPESNFHKQLKELIYNSIYSKEIKLQDHNNNIIDFDFNLDSLEYEQILKNGNKIIRADVYVGFKEEHNVFGKGIIFEVQLTPQYDYLEQQRELDRAFSKNSVCWIKINNYVDKKTIQLKEELPNLTIKAYAKIITDVKKEFTDEIENVVKYRVELMNDYIEEAIRKVVPLKCPKCEDYLIKRKGSYGDFYGCNNYPACKYNLRGDYNGK